MWQEELGAGNTVYRQPQAQQAVKQAQEGTMEIGSDTGLKTGLQ